MKMTSWYQFKSWCPMFAVTGLLLAAVASAQDGGEPAYAENIRQVHAANSVRIRGSQTPNLIPDHTKVNLMLRQFEAHVTSGADRVIIERFAASERAMRSVDGVSDDFGCEQVVGKSVSEIDGPGIVAQRQNAFDAANSRSVARFRSMLASLSSQGRAEVENFWSTGVGDIEVVKRDYVAIARALPVRAAWLLKLFCDPPATTPLGPIPNEQTESDVLRSSE